MQAKIQTILYEQHNYIEAQSGVAEKIFYMQ